MTRQRHLDYVVADPATSGHHPEYLRRILRALLAGTTMRVGYASTTELRRLPGIESLHREFNDRIVAIPFAHSVAPGGNAVSTNLRWWRRMRSWYQAAHRDFEMAHLVLPYIDYSLLAFAALGMPFGESRVSAISMRATGAGLGQDRKAAVKWWALNTIASRASMVRLFLLDMTAASELAKSHANVSWLPDPARVSTTDAASARARLGVRPGNFVVLVYGAITSRKGLRQLSGAIGATRCGVPLTVMVVGMADSTAAEALRTTEEECARHGHQYIRIPGYVDAETEDLAFASAGCVWMVYDSHPGMSGVLVQAALNSKPVVATAEGLIGHYTRNLRSGIAVNPSNAREAAAAIDRLATESGAAEMMAAAGRQGFAAHSEENFAKLFLAGISDRG